MTPAPSSAMAAVLRDRSFIDPVSNVTLLSSVDLEAHLGSLLELDLPRFCLPAFLHEATHHWSFFSPVGAALALLKLRARRRAALGALGEAVESWDVIDDLVRYRCCSSALAPFSEGLALFAEFDDVPTTSPLVSEVMLSVATFFLGGDPDIAQDELLVGTPLLLLLRDLRSWPPTTDRKADVLVGRLRTDVGGGYLPGYLVVKNMWIEAWRRCQRLADADLAMQYLYAYVFRDFGLVAHLLDPDVADVMATGPIGTYIVQRLQSFHLEDHESNLDALERIAAVTTDAALDSFDTTPTPNLGTDPELWALGHERLVAADRELREEADVPGLRGALAMRDLWALARRELLCVGRMAVEVRVGDNGHATVWREGRLLLAGPCAESELFGSEGEGSLEAFVNPWRHGRYIAAVATLAGRRAVTYVSRPLGGAMKAQFEGYGTSLDDAATDDELLEQFTVEHIAKEQYVLDIVDEHVGAEMDRCYTHLALGFVPDELIDARIAEMREEGFYPILGTIALVRVLAWAGLVTRFTIDEDIEATFASARPTHGFAGSFAEARAAIAAASREKLVDPLLYDGPEGSVFCCV